MRAILQLAAWHAIAPPMRILAAILFLISSAALAQTGLKYRVEIVAPKDMAEVLSKGLNLERWQNDPQMTPEQLRRLADEGVREARELAATEGYFSARVDLAIEESLSGGAEQPITREHLAEALKEVRPTTLEWLATARNYAKYSNSAGQYDDVAAFLKANGL